MFRKIFAVFTIALLMIAWANIQAFDVNISGTVDTDYEYTNSDTLRGVETSDVVATLGAENILCQIIAIAPTDSFHAIFEGSNDETTWTNLDADGDSTMHDGPGNFDYIFPFATAYRFYRMRINTEVDASDTCTVVIRFKVGGRTYVR